MPLGNFIFTTRLSRTVYFFFSEKSLPVILLTFVNDENPSYFVVLIKPKAAYTSSLCEATLVAYNLK